MVADKIQILRPQYEIARSWKSPFQYSMKINVGQLLVRINLAGAHQKEVFDFLTFYYKNFSPLPTQSEISFDLTLFTPEGDLGIPYQPLWNDTDWSGKLVNEKDGSYVIAHRDYILWLDPSLKKGTALCPKIGPENTDSIDNLLTTSVLHLIELKSSILLHASTVKRNGLAYVFFGPSGAGKSTLAKQSFEQDQLPVLSGDQIFLNLNHGKLMAIPQPITIPEFKRHHPALCLETIPVAALTYLENKTDFYYEKLMAQQILPFLIKEVFFSFKEISSPKSSFKLVSEMIQCKDLHLGKMGYKKNISFWKDFEREIK